MRPRLLDLFAGAGGAGKGYHDAGFDVIGVDIEPQPNYPFAFIQGDALEWLAAGIDADLLPYEAIHASPPCQAHTPLQAMANAREHPDLIEPTRALLKATGLPYVIENVPGAPLHNPITLCGSSFGLQADGRQLRRHRWFECSFPVMVPSCQHMGGTIGIYGDHARKARRHGDDSQYNAADSLRYGGEAMGIDWMTWPELAQAIPPVFTEHVGGYLMSALSLEVAA